MNRPNSISNNWALLALGYANTENASLAMAYAQKVLTFKKPFPVALQRTHLALHKVYESQHRWEQSLAHYKIYTAIRDTLRQEARTKELASLQKKNELERLTLENQQEQQLQAERLTTVQKQAELDRLKSQAKADALSQQARFAEQQRLLANERAKTTLTRLETRQKLQQQTYEQRTLLQQRTHQHETNLQQRTRTWLLGGLFSVLLFTMALALVYRQNRRQKSQIEQLNVGLEQTVQTRTAQLQQANDELRQKNQAIEEVNNRIQATEMSALRAQMNPHFIFNCLNSIQFFTAQNEAEKASDYLTKFSRLIRLVLENSKSEKVTLTNELETLRLYIEMEVMRFQQKVRYAIQVDDRIDVDLVQIPPLLVQPFVENAIWHGLMHKEDGGNVHVHVSQPKDDLLHIYITDDGVGRQKAAEYKSRSATRHKSFGMKLTADRIELINQLYNTNTQVQVEDLLDEQGNARGTKVSIDIPI